MRDYWLAFRPEFTCAIASDTVLKLPSRRLGAVFDLVLDGEDELVRPLLQEGGGHRWQRVPPTERKGRVQTSTVTVSVLEVVAESLYRLRDQDIKIFTTTAGGPGGQHQNKTQSAVIMRHLPTGIEASASERCQHQNRRIARAILESRVAENMAGAARDAVNTERRSQVGSGERGDKIRTYRQQDDVAADHRSGRKVRLSDVMKGRIELFGNS